MHGNYCYASIIKIVKNLTRPEYKEVSKALFGSLCAHTLSMFEKGNMREHPDLLEAFMSFLSQVSLFCHGVKQTNVKIKN